MIFVTFEQVVGTEDRERTVVLPAIPHRGDLVELPAAGDGDRGPLFLGAMRGTVSHVVWRSAAKLGLELLADGCDLLPVVVLITVPAT